MLTLTTEGNVVEFAPGNRVRGQAGWRLDSAPRDAYVRLFWHTEGRGTQDVGVVEEVTLQCNGPAMTHEYQFTLPEGPYSFSGTLLTLQWAIELTLNKGKDVARIDLVVSPWRERLVLRPFEGDPR